MSFKVLFWLQEALRIGLRRCGLMKSSMMPVKPLQQAYVRRHRLHRRPVERRLSMRELKVLVVSQLPFGSTSESRRKAMQPLVGDIASVDVQPWISSLGFVDHLLTNQLYMGNRVSQLNRLVLEKAREFQPHMAWIDRGLYVRPETLSNLLQGGCLWLIHFSPDNHRILGNQSRHYFQNIPLYDMHVTTKRDNIDWLLRWGARRVEYTGKGFDPEIHRPIVLSRPDEEKFECDVGFVGHWEPSREMLLLELQNRGYRLKVWGGGWERARHKIPLFADCPHLIGDDYARAIQGAKINLCLLSDWFKDQTTARSVEIPACGKFMLAERNAEHQELFKEGVEAEFYEGREELLKKIDYYLRHEREREAVAQAGRARCLAGYSNQDRLKTILTRILEF